MLVINVSILLDVLIRLMGMISLFVLPVPNSMVLFGSVLIFFVIVAVHGWKTLGTRGVCAFFVIAYTIPLLYEYTNALGFGGLVGCTVTYSDLLGPKFLGKTPYIIPLVWAIFMYCAYTMTNIIFNRIKTNPESEETISLPWFGKMFGLGVVSGLIMVSMDLLIDPVMVSLGAWHWSTVGPFFGIPLWNYEGWVEIPTVIFLLYSLYRRLRKRTQVYIGGENRSSLTVLVVVLYLVVLLLFVMYTVNEQLLLVIPWAALPMIFFSIVTLLRFSQMKSSNKHLVS
jgi:uncharacterized membrane protein